MENSKKQVPSIEELLTTDKKVVPIIKGKGKKKFIIIPLVVIVIIVVAGYFLYNNLQDDFKEREDAAFRLGAQYGHKAVLLEIYNKAETCMPVQLTNDGATLNLLATACLSGA